MIVAVVLMIVEAVTSVGDDRGGFNRDRRDS